MNNVDEGKPIDVTSDYIFKGIFSDELRTKDFLINILVGDDKVFPSDTIIEGLEYLRTEYIQNKLPQDAKKIIFDLQLKTNHGIFIIEMQKNASADYLKRVEFYNATAYSNQQIKDGQSSMRDYTQGLPIVTISVINGKLFDDAVPVVSYHLNIERKTQKQYMKAFTYVFIELEKFGNKLYDQSNINKEEEDWLLFMKEQDLSQKYHNEQVNSAVEYVQNIKYNKYEEYVRHQMSEVAAQKELESAKGEGKLEGKQEEKLEIAKKMLLKNISISDISDLTNLSISEIKKLQS
jgi:predicted transposase/invertase (TIGR01784 family)